MCRPEYDAYGRLQAAEKNACAYGLPQGSARTAAALVSLWRARRVRMEYSFGGRRVADVRRWQECGRWTA